LKYLKFLILILIYLQSCTPSPKTLKVPIQTPEASVISLDNRFLLSHPEYIDSLKVYLNSAIRDSAFPGCAISVGLRGKLVFQEGFGYFTYDSRFARTKTNTIFDLASLTKVIATTTLAMILYEQGQLPLDRKVVDILPDFYGDYKDLVTVRHLLTHTHGLIGWKKFYINLEGKDQIFREICRTDLISPPGMQYVYSDLGMILLQRIIEKITHKSLDLMVQEYITGPLNMDRTFYNPDTSRFGEIAPTEFCDWRQVLVRGFVHDENAYAMGGVSGHAGLFSTVEDLSVFCQMYLNGGIFDGQRILQAETIDLFIQKQNLVKGSTRALGWDTRSEVNSMAGDYMSLRAYGHSGFTGTTIWIDPEYKLFVVFLSNRVYPTRENLKIRAVRPKVHNYIMKAILNKDTK
jgi:CubicO group peptidase (beta-lactamase class C family)